MLRGGRFLFKKKSFRAGGGNLINQQDYLAFARRVKEELENLNRIEGRLAGYNLFPGIHTNTFRGYPLSDEDSCRVLETYLHDYYSCLEKIFIHVAVDIDNTLPKGEDWHKKLLQQMTWDITDARPSVLSKTTASKLNDLRGFRHVFRNIYGFNIHPEKIIKALNNLSEISLNVKSDINMFIDKMDCLLGVNLNN
jgi:hypothetical protein